MAVSIHQKQQPERKYPMPEYVVTIMPFEGNPLHNVEPRAGAAHRWSIETSLFTEREYRRIRNASQFVAYFYPFCTDPDRYDTMVKVMMNFGIVDDHLECPYGDMYRRVSEVDTICGQMHGVCDKLLAAIDGTGDGQHVSAHHWKPYVLAAYALYDTICATFNDIQKRRFVRLTRDWAEGMIDESHDIDRKRQFNNLDEFYEVREKSVASGMCYQLIEYTDHLYVPDDEWRNPIFQQLLKQLNRVVLMANDMYSLEKELMDAGGNPSRVYNGVAVLAQIDNISLTNSMTQYAKEYLELEKSTMVLANEIMEAHWTSPDTRVWVRHALFLAGGHWKVSTIYDRYNTILDVNYNES